MTEEQHALSFQQLRQVFRAVEKATGSSNPLYFDKPVDVKEYTDYLDVVKAPISLSEIKV